MRIFPAIQQPRYDNFLPVEKPQPLTKRMSLPDDTKAKNIGEWTNGEWIKMERLSMLEQLRSISDRLK